MVGGSVGRRRMNGREGERDGLISQLLESHFYLHQSDFLAANVPALGLGMNHVVHVKFVSHSPVQKASAQDPRLSILLPLNVPETFVCLALIHDWAFLGEGGGASHMSSHTPRGRFTFPHPKT